MFQGKVALVTGGGSGIGKACTLTLVKLGCKVCLSERRKEKLEETLEEIKKMGGEGLIVPADISKEEDVKNIFQEIEKKWNRLDFVIANAGMNGVWAPLEDLSVEEFDRTMNVNLKGTFMTIKYAMPLLKSSKGNIVVVSSVNGTRMFSNTGAYAYACSKGGQLILTKMLAPELAKFQIRINCVCPGMIDTPIRREQTELRNLQGVRLPVEFPQGEIPLSGKEPGTAQQVADVIKFLLSNDSNHVTGTEIYIDGAQSLIQA